MLCTLARCCHLGSAVLHLLKESLHLCMFQNVTDQVLQGLAASHELLHAGQYQEKTVGSKDSSAASFSPSQTHLNVSGCVASPVVCDTVLAEVISTNPLWLRARAHLTSGRKRKICHSCLSNQRSRVTIWKPWTSFLPAASVLKASAGSLYSACSGRAGPSARTWLCLCSVAESVSVDTPLSSLMS